jgi:RNA polymerase sigma-70 factor (ECF subfamily)
MAALTDSWDPGSPNYIGRLKALPTWANGRPAAAVFASRDGGDYTPLAITVFQVDGDRIVAMTAFHEPRLFPAFGLPMTFPERGRLSR